MNKPLKNKRGVTVIQVVLVLVIMIAIAVVFNPLGLINKANKGRATNAWVQDLSNINNMIVTLQDKERLLFQVNLRSSNPPYRLKANSPAVAAYDVVNSNTVDKGTLSDTDRIKLTYSLTGVDLVDVAIEGTGGSFGALTVGGENGLKVYDYANREITTSNPLNGITFNGSEGFAAFVNESISNIEEHIVLGLLGLDGSALGADYQTQTDDSIRHDKYKELIEYTFGSGEGTGNNEFDSTSSTPSRVVTLRPLQQSALKELLEATSRFYEEDRYRLFMVTDVLSKSRAKELSNLPTELQDPMKFDEYYEGITKNLPVDSVVVMPAGRSERVFSETSDFKLMKFTLND